ncbi:peptidoglycan editing factor PgeF [Cellulomonas carbonis]|uniref:Purine nucleoside phosphorylase n=1 Tax=Cellulomonas carbonis T26 TaxID=947969 RepID=A0A0A0BRE0_9CELL|nr:peptidoglycan editing factor PgeF [Cellulomonas carbonis]KGM09664.1 multicopper polyphenol oxidase [Cellulomonas carbonis T26]GGB97004.1 laccase domain protein [Cellulomonas carbonis]
MTDADARSLVLVDLGPGVRCAFTTVATGNIGSAVGDDPVRVRAVRGSVDAWAGTRVAFARQVHGAAVHVVDGVPGAADEVVAEADALVTAHPGVALGVVVADCVPVLLAERAAGVVAAVHAGRRGVVADVVTRAVEVMASLGAEPAAVRAVVGPAACGGCYEVPAALRDEVAAVVPEAWSTTSWGTPALDLPAAVRAQLDRAGVARVAMSGACTIEDVRWFSHRAATGGAVPAAVRGLVRPVGRVAGVVRVLPSTARS